ncbi:SAP domain [Sesbania bispinosa]|nr:SAP domain [Sesbania bispinosa]
MDARRGKSVPIVLSSSEDDDDDCEEEEECSDGDDVSESDGSDVDDQSLSDKVVALLQEGNDLESLKLNECKAYLRKHGLRLAGNRAVCIARIREHWRLKHGSGYTLYPRSSFIIDCTGDVCMGDVVLFRQKVYEKFDKVTRHGRQIGNRTVAGRVVKESYGAAKQQHTFTVEVLWSSGVRKLPPLSPLLVKGRNLYKQKTYRQRWKNEADRVKVLSEKHRRGAAARFVRTSKQKRKSCYTNGSKGSKRQHEIQNTKRLKIGKSCELDKVRHLDGSRRANDFQPQEATSSTQATWNESASSRAFRATGGRHYSAELDHYEVPINPLYASNRQIPYQCQVNSQRRMGPSELLYYQRGLIPNMTGFPPFRPSVSEFTSRTRNLVPGNGHHHAHRNLYNFEMKNLHVDDRPLQLSPRGKYGWRKYGI